jgi:oxygen-independent coproporphyrinogen-3 oxidase
MKITPRTEKAISLVHNVRFGGLPTHYPSIAAWDPAWPSPAAVPGAWKTSLAKYGGRPLGIYLNVPFCRAKCRYCFLDVVPAAPGSVQMERFTAAAGAEMALLSKVFSGRKFSSVYIGGGTPNALGAGQLARLLAELRRNFALKPGAQVSMEANPDLLDGEKLAALAAGGVTMVMLGVQSFSRAVNAACGRAQDVTGVAKAFRLIRAAGIKDINADLLCGLPGQTRAGFLADVKKLASLRPSQAHLNRIKPLSGALPPALKAELSGWQAEGLALLERAGYQRLDEESASLGGARNLQGDYRFHLEGSLLGLGPGALSHAWGVMRGQNLSVPEDYARAALAGRAPVMRGIRLTPEDELRQYLLNELLHGEPVGPAAVKKRFGAAGEKLLLRLESILGPGGALVKRGSSLTCGLRSGDWLEVTAALYSPRHLEKIAGRYSLK